MTSNRWKVPVENLRAHFDPQQFPFTTTEELPNLEGIIGQGRAVRAMEFGLQVHGQRYNLYVAGAPGTGKNTLVQGMITQVAQTQPIPDDWCYVHNFQDPNRPKALCLPTGKAREFQREMERLIASLRSDLSQVFRSEDYQGQRQTLEERFSKARTNLMRKLKQRAKDYGFQITASRQGMFATLLSKGKPVKIEPFEAVNQHAHTRRTPKHRALHEAIHTFVQQVHTLQEEVHENIAQLNRQVAFCASEHRFEGLREQYHAFPKVLEYLRAVQQDLLEHFEDFLVELEATVEGPGPEREPSHRSLARYAVNVLVDHGQTQGAPLVEEPNPTYMNLVGRIEREGYFGALYTDLTLIRAGSLLRARGGYLLMNALDILREPNAWMALKRALKRQEVTVEEVGEASGFMTQAGINPEPIPIQVRVILVGSPDSYVLLHTSDEDFRELFKVKVEFDVQQPCTEESPVQYGRFIARLCRDEGLRHFDRDAVATVLEQACRWADHQKKLSVRFGDLADLIREASHWARQEDKASVARRHVQKALEERIYRSNLVAERLRELIAEGTLMVDVTGSVIGQINALSLSNSGDTTFALPARITARVFLGEAGIVNIEREVELSEETHSKGVLILSGYLGGRYAHEVPLSLSATLCFEQSYDEVVGDSASAAELVALLSALSEMPIDQGIALTGSVNQHGELQAISGVNEKIEGFYAVCQALGLTRTQGVIIPRPNLQHLMLNEDVVQAVAASSFHLYAVSTVDEALEILMGCSAGERQADGSYPIDSVNAAVLHRLHEMHDRLHAFDTRRTSHQANRPRRTPLP
jgi:lon-related putative ATP-dependent protease